MQFEQYNSFLEEVIFPANSTIALISADKGDARFLADIVTQFVYADTTESIYGGRTQY